MGIVQIQNSVPHFYLVQYLLHETVGKEEDQVVPRLFAVTLIKQFFSNRALKALSNEMNSS
jgi:hypothetical protein